MERLRFTERLVIEQELKVGKGVREIGRLLDRDHSVISRELKPDKDQGFLAYSARRAQLRAERLARVTNKRKLDKDIELKDFVVGRLSEDDSPEQIAGRLEKEPPAHLVGRSIVLETIYQFVYSGERNEQGELLYKHLRKGQPKRIKSYSRKPVKTKIPDRTSIHERPELVGYGHWESDSLFGKKNQPISVQYEKKSLLVRLHKLIDQTAQATREAIEDTLEMLPESWRQTMTFDNGTENYEHTRLKAAGLETYFCDPYSAWQKGGVENANNLVRQYIPKGVDLNKYTDRDIHAIQERLNNRPRKTLQYKTPNEIFQQVVH